MLAPEKIVWGIIGCGDVTEVKSGPAFNKVANSELLAVMRRDEVLLADYAKRHQVPRQYSNVEDLIADPAINAIYIAIRYCYGIGHAMAMTLAVAPYFFLL